MANNVAPISKTSLLLKKLQIPAHSYPYTNLIKTNYSKLDHYTEFYRKYPGYSNKHSIHA